MPSSIIILHIEITVLGYLGISLVFTHTHIILLFISLLQYIPTKKKKNNYSSYLPIFPNESPNVVEQPFSFGLKYPVVDGNPFEHQGADPKSEKSRINLA